MNATYIFEMAAFLANFLMWLSQLVVKLRAFIFDSVMDLYRDYTHTHTHTHKRNYAAVDNILKIIILKNIHILHFFPMHNML